MREGFYPGFRENRASSVCMRACMDLEWKGTGVFTAGCVGTRRHTDAHMNCAGEGAGAPYALCRYAVRGGGNNNSAAAKHSGCNKRQ